jgi:hypothetical protein
MYLKFVVFTLGVILLFEDGVTVGFKIGSKGFGL